MLLLLQVAAFCQLFFLPGLLIMYLLRFRPDPLFLPPLAFSLSGVFNYVLVMLLSVAGIFCREAMLTLLIAECGLLGVFLCRNGLRPCGGRMREELRSFLREGGRIRNVLFLLAAGVLVWQILVAVRSFGSIFLSWDSVLSWNRWAAAWADGTFLEQRTNGYPQLVPCNWAVAYQIIGENLNFVPKGIVLLCPVLISLLLIALAWRRREDGLLAAVPLTAWFFHNTDPLAGGGEVDFVVTFFCFASIAFLLKVREERSWKMALCAGIAAIGSACVKPSGVVFLVLLPVLARIWDFPSGRGFRRALIVYFLLALLVAAPYYLFFAGRVADGVENSKLRTVTCEIYGSKTRGEIAAAAGKVFLCRFLGGVPTESVRHADADFSNGVFRGIGNLAADRWPVLIAVFLLALPILLFARGVPVWSGLFYAVALPYTGIWMLFYSYDLRNLMPLQPLLACGAGFALIRIGRMPVFRLVYGALLTLFLVGGAVWILSRLDVRRYHREMEYRIGSPGLNRELENWKHLVPCATDYQFLEFVPGFGSGSFVFVEYSLAGALEKHREAVENPEVKSLLVPEYAAKEFREDLEKRLKNGEIQLQFRKYGYRFYKKMMR